MNKQPAPVVPYSHKPFPAWFYGPDGQSAIFDSESEVPDGWADHPTGVSGGSHPALNPGNEPLSDSQNKIAFGAGREDVETTSYDDMDLDALKVICAERDIQYHPNARETKLRALLAADDVANPKSEA